MTMINLNYIESVEHKITPSGEIRINCPQCDDDKFHMYINMRKRLFNCFKCGYCGRFQSESTLIDWEDMEQTIKERQEALVSKQAHFEKSFPITKIIKTLPNSISCLYDIGLSSNDCQIFQAVRAYLSHRGITLDEMRKYNISCSLEKSGRYRNSVIFPIYRDNSLVYFVCRRYNESKPKYINAPWPKDDILFFAYSKVSTSPIVLCEGIFDALAVCRIGYNAIALLGKQVTGKQLKRLELQVHPQKEDLRYIIYLDEDAFSHAVNLRLQLMALNIESVMIYSTPDAADLYVENKDQLRNNLDAAAKVLGYKP